MTIEPDPDGKDVVEIDGSEGGGQVVRSALSMSALTGRAVAFENVRGGRSNPGLSHQHLAAVRAVAAICDAETDGATEGSESFSFDPGPIEAGEYAVDVGTAGSVALVFDAVLPLAIGLQDGLAMTVEGGTDVKWAQPLATYQRVKLPLLRRFGWQAAVDCDRRGFYPVGGGRATLTLGPSRPGRMELKDRGAIRGARVYGFAADSLADADVAHRLVETAAAELESADVDVLERVTGYGVTDSPGAVVGIRLDAEGTLAGFDALGERGTPAETVATRATEDASGFLDGDATVDRHLADQLLLPVALAGGRVAIPSVTDHVANGLDVLDAFGVEASVDDAGPTPVLEAPGMENHRGT